LAVFWQFLVGFRTTFVDGKKTNKHKKNPTNKQKKGKEKLLTSPSWVFYYHHLQSPQ